MKTVSYELASELLEVLKSMLRADDDDLEETHGSYRLEMVREAIAKAEAAMAEPQPDADGWIKWEGGECPVPDGVLVDVEYRDGGRQFLLPANELVDGRDRDASICFWGNDGLRNDIIAYRINAFEGD